MTTQIRSLGFTNSLQRLTWNGPNNTQITAYIWGAGGGRGGNDRGSGGLGSGGGYTEVGFVINNGDVVDIAVGGPGGNGVSGRGSAPGGAAGASYTTDTVFNSRTAIASPTVITSTNSNYVGFLNTYGIWTNPVSATYFDRTYTVNFPVSINYDFVASCDNYGTIYLDDEPILDVQGFTSTYSTTRTVSAGNHTVRMYGVNTGGPGSMALTINGGQSYSGGRGGVAGPRGSSGGGGGGGGATVIFKNNVPLAVAGGGGGGGGAGSPSSGSSAPGSRGQAADGISAGQSGQNKSGDGGGGGAGGGGMGGGNGGLTRGGDSGAEAGAFGRSSAPSENPSGTFAGGRNNAYYPGSAGSAGSAGAAVLVFEIPGIFAHDGTSFQPVNNSWIKVNDTWREIQSSYIKTNGVWTMVAGGAAPDFIKISGNFGSSPR
jgi:hypothetical protein